MKVGEDAGRMLAYLYNKLIKEGKQSISGDDISNETNWESNRINHAFDYISKLELIEKVILLGNTHGVKNFIITGLTPSGINTIEDEPEFKRNFSIGVNLLLANFTWGVSEA